MARVVSQNNAAVCFKNFKIAWNQVAYRVGQKK